MLVISLAFRERSRDLLVDISILLHVNDHVRSVAIIPSGTTDTLMMAMIMVITVNAKTPNSMAFLRNGRCKFHSSATGIERTATHQSAFGCRGF